VTPTPTTIRLGELVRSERLWIKWDHMRLAKEAGIGRELLKKIESGDIVILETAIHLLHVLEAGVGVLQLAEHLRNQEARHRAQLPSPLSSSPLSTAQPIR